MLSEKNAIQLVASLCSRRQPGGTSRERSNTEMLSIPRNPPSKRLDPSESLRLSHHEKLNISLVKMRTRKARSVPPSSWWTCQAAHACTGGLTSPKSHS